MSKLTEFKEYLSDELGELACNYCEAIEGSPFMAEDLDPIQFATAYFEKYITQFTMEMNEFVVDGDSHNAHDIIEELVKARTLMALSILLSTKLERTYLDLLNTPKDPSKRKPSTKRNNAKKKN